MMGCAAATPAKTPFNGWVCSLFINNNTDATQAICAKAFSNEIKKIKLNDLDKCISGVPCKWIMMDTENFLLFQNSMN